LDNSLEGRTGKPFKMVVELGKIREFARATKSRNPAYEGEPGDTPVSPGTFLTSALFWKGPDANPFAGTKRNWSRILHGEQEFKFHGPPPRAGDVLIGQTRIDRVYEKAGKRGGSMIFTEEVTEFRDPDGRLVAESKATSIETSKPAGKG
jgi:N-terminal half of MaoC dehydratase